MEEASKSPPRCPSTVTVRRNPHRRARPTPAVSNFPTEDIAAMDVQPPKPSNPPIVSHSDTLKVFLRLRPLSIAPPSKASSKSLKSNQPKTKKLSKSCLTINDSHSVTIWPPCGSNRSKSEIYSGFANVFSPDTSQDEVYEKLMKPIVEEFLNGKSGLLAAVGPSGSGKTHTVFGSTKEPGLVPRAIRHIFGSDMGYQSKPSRSFYLSLFEILSERGKGEKLSDLSKNGADIYMQQSAVRGLKEVLVTDVAHAESLLTHAMAKRATAMTNSNSQSSRSQCIINIRCVVGEIDGEGESGFNGAVLTFVDLAGAEREKKTGNQGGRLLESNFINNTSMSLLEHQKNPKKALQKHFQSSMLTRYLRDYLEGRKRMALILTVRSGEEDCFDASFLLRQASPYMEIKFNKVEDTSNLPRNKRQNQTITTNQQKRVKLSDADACKDDVQRTNSDSSEMCKQGLLGGYEGDQTPRVNANTVPEGNSIDVKTEREYHIMRGFAKALWNVLKQYKEKVKTVENEVDVLTENLRIARGRYLAMEKELCDLKAWCSCKFNDSANAPAPNPDSVEESGLISFRSISFAQAGPQWPISADVLQVHLGEVPTSITNPQTIGDNKESDAILRKSSPDHQVEHSLMDSEISCDHVRGVDCAAACLSWPHVTDCVVLGERSGCNTPGNRDKDNVAIGPGNNLWSEPETDKLSGSGTLGARRPKRKSVENLDSEGSALIGSRALSDSEEESAKVHHGDLQDLPLCTKNSDSIDENGQSDAILRKVSQGANQPSHDCETSAPQIHQAGQSLIAREISNGQFSRDAAHKKDFSKKGNRETTDAVASLPQPDKDHMVQGGSSGCDTPAKEDKVNNFTLSVVYFVKVNHQSDNSVVSPVGLEVENVTIGPRINSSSELETKQTSHCKPQNRGRPKRQLMPASSVLLRDISGIEIADESDIVKKGKGGQRLAEDESKRSKGF
ncbi:hypothetical protein Cgig2_029079 [Carnegiea gigantea]|uniref:Kinesin motor domain-containing protein n=1 Tax=Carnegiea gigantea TaxID=171969 RepID=A0A9Q1KAA6_9CARY|nr:hypothetical protein Cgig2_029079 [Carnegiea gigantea]